MHSYNFVRDSWVTQLDSKTVNMLLQDQTKTSSPCVHILYWMQGTIYWCQINISMLYKVTLDFKAKRTIKCYWLKNQIAPFRSPPQQIVTVIKLFSMDLQVKWSMAYKIKFGSQYMYKSMGES